MTQTSANSIWPSDLGSRLSERTQMPEDRSDRNSTLALNTKLEEEFVSPLTSMRGALEILRDFPDLSEGERIKFIETALQGCARLERGVEELASAVYAAGQQAQATPAEELLPAEQSAYAKRIEMLNDAETIEIDFSDFVFSSAKIVNDFYDVIDQTVETTGRTWYFLVNYRDCRVWPEAWVAFAHRGKKVNVNYSLGTVRYVEQQTTDGSKGRRESDRLDPDMFNSREEALARIQEMRRAGAN